MPLRVLFVEDSPDDVELIARELGGHGFVTETRTVMTRAQFLEALRSAPWDVILCDHSMTGFSSAEALHLLRHYSKDIPLIIVSGTIGEDAAVDAMRAGASDYVLKHNLKRLGPAVERELRETANRRMQRSTEEALKAAELQLHDARRLETVGRFAAGVAHDFNNLLTVILGFTEFLTDRLSPSDAAYRDAAEIRAAAQRAAGLTGQLLAFSRDRAVAEQAGQASAPAATPEEPPADEANLPAEFEMTRTTTILLAEDEESVRTFLEMALVRAGHTVIATRSGSEAVARGRQSKHSVDLMISDVVMPGLSGPDAAEQLRQVHPRMRMLFLSGYAGHTALPAHVNPNAFLQKPFTVEALLAKVREQLSQGAQ